MRFFVRTGEERYIKGGDYYVSTLRKDTVVKCNKTDSGKYIREILKEVGYIEDGTDRNVILEYSQFFDIHETELNNVMLSLDLERKKLFNQNQTLASEIARLLESKDEIIDKNEALTEENTNLKRRIRELENTLEAFIKRNKEQGEQKEIVYTENRKLEEEIKRLKEHIEDRERTIEKFVADNRIAWNKIRRIQTVIKD